MDMFDKKIPGAAVVVVDVQGDFTILKNGSLGVAGTDQAYIDKVAGATQKFKTLGYPVFATQDWHPKDHISFFTSHPGKSVYDVINTKGGSQVLWPPHCVQGSGNAKLLLDSTLFDAVVQKGKDPAHDSYSGFFDDGGKATELERILRKEGVKSLILYGLATDYCVKATALDGVKLGFSIQVIEDLCRGVGEETSRAAVDEMSDAGVSFL